MIESVVLRLVTVVGTELPEVVSLDISIVLLHADMLVSLKCSCMLESDSDIESCSAQLSLSCIKLELAGHPLE